MVRRWNEEKTKRRKSAAVVCTILCAAVAAAVCRKEWAKPALRDKLGEFPPISPRRLGQTKKEGFYLTWDDLRITCLQKIFEIKGDTLTQDSNTQQYIKSMPAAANEAMLILATAGRYIRKCTTLDFGSTDAPKEDFSMGGWNGYDLKRLAPDFYSLEEIYHGGADGYGLYQDYRTEGAGVLLLPEGAGGTFRIWYNAYPPKVTKETPGNTVIELHPEEASMIALYMAGQLYKDDDISIAQIYMNEFMTWLEELKQSGRTADSRNNGNGGGFYSQKGWF